jgi:hypothetical protein
MTKEKMTQDLSKLVMKKIREDKVRVQPKWQLMMGSFLVAFGLITGMLLTMYLLSLSWYLIQMHSSWSYLWFGDRGLKAFYQSFPFLYLLLALLSFVLGIKIITTYDFSYKVKWQYWMVGLIMGILVAEVGIGALRVNQKLANHNLMKTFYMEYKDRQTWYKAEVEKVELQQMLVTPMGRPKKMMVKWGEFTRLPYGGGFHSGQWIIVVGDWQGEEFVAEGISGVEKP